MRFTRTGIINPQRIPLYLLIGLSISLGNSIAAGADGLPEVRVVSVRRVFDNGEHNAFTDLCRFKGRFYLTFRSCPDGHPVHPTASIIVLTSDDANTWRQVHRFNVENRDTRDPHFLIFGDKLFVYTGTWYCGDRSPSREERDLNEHLGYAVWSPDGDEWNGPSMLEGTYGHYIWRAATHAGKAYICGRRKHQFVHTETGGGQPSPIVESAMLQSDDGLIWRTAGLFQTENGDETAFLFEPDGAVLAVARRGSGNAQLCRSQPPYTDWQRDDLDRYVGGPLLTRWQDRYVVGGRRTGDGRTRTSLSWLVDGRLHEFAELPSSGDNSYPGFVQLSPTRALVSYYSSHEEDQDGNVITAVYLAELEIQ